MKRDYKLFVKDILDAIEKIESFIKGMSFQEFVDDDKTASAVVRKLEVIGEASKNVPKFLKQQHGELPWSDMARMRDKVIHAYFGIDYEIIWKVIKEKLPQIKPFVATLLQEPGTEGV